MESIYSDPLETIRLERKTQEPERLSDRHILIVEDTRGQREVELRRSVHSVGRNSKCDVLLSSNFASRYHAAILHMPFSEQKNGHYCIIDGNLSGKRSINGLFVNGKKVTTHDLQDGDCIVFGPDANATYYRLTSIRDSRLTSELDATIEADIGRCLENGDSI